MNTQPFISIVIPAFNEEKYLPSCLESLRKQDYPKEMYEIILVDNGSTDATEKIAQSFGAHVFNYTTEKGVAGARQFGFSQAKGEIVASTDADTVLPTNWLASLQSYLNEESIVCVAGKAFPSDSNFLTRIMFELYDWFVRINQIFGKALPWGFNFAVKKSAFDAIGGFDTRLRTSEDWNLAIRLQKRFGTKSVLYVPQIKAFTSTRKQERLDRFIRYFWSGLVNYINVVLLGKTKSQEMTTVR